MDPVSVIQGDSPIILAQPHSGTFVPEGMLSDLNDLGRQLIDTDWHIPELYDGVCEDANIVRANFNRYVIDANRNPEGVSLYPEQNTTELVPLSTFDGKPIWSRPPTEQDIVDRLDIYHSAYHKALSAELARVKSIHGIAVLYDCHSIRSEIPYLFDGLLPDLNIGSNGGESCSTPIQSAIERVCENLSDFSYVVNGRFKGGWTTRHYVHLAEGIHAIQMELAQRTYLKSEKPPFEYDKAKAMKLKRVLRNIFHEINNSIEVRASAGER